MTALVAVAMRRDLGGASPVCVGARWGLGAKPFDHPVVHRECGGDEHRELDVGIGRTGGVRRRDVGGGQVARLASHGSRDVEQRAHLVVESLGGSELDPVDERHELRRSARSSNAFANAPCESMQ